LYTFLKLYAADQSVGMILSQSGHSQVTVFYKKSCTRSCQKTNFRNDFVSDSEYVKTWHSEVIRK